MKFTCFKKDIIKALNTVSKAVTNRTTLPILKGILLKADENSLTLIAYDLDILIETTIPITCYEKGETVVVAKLFNEIVRKLPGEEVNISNDDEKVTIKSDKSEFNIIGLNADEFPTTGAVSEKDSITLKSSDLIDMINKTAFAASLEESRGIIIGVLVLLKENSLTMVALDGFRMALNKKEIPNENEKSIIVTSKILLEVSKLLSESENTDEVSIIFDERRALIEIDNTKVIIRLLEGEFIPYENILPKESKIKITVEKEDLYSAIERASLLSREGKNNLIKMNITENTMIISSKSEEGNLVEEIIIDRDGDDLEIGFNAKYLLDSLKAIDDESIIMNFDSSVSPCLIKPTVGDAFVHLVLPVRM